MLLYTNSQAILKIIENNLFGLMKKVLTELKLESEALDLLSCVTESFDLEIIGEDVLNITKEVFQRMSFYKKSTRAQVIPEHFIKSTFTFCARFILNHGVDKFMSLMNSIQENFILNFFEKYGHTVGRFGKNDVYRRHVLTSF